MYEVRDGDAVVVVVKKDVYILRGREGSEVGCGFDGRLTRRRSSSQIKLFRLSEDSQTISK